MTGQANQQQWMNKFGQFGPFVFVLAIRDCLCGVSLNAAVSFIIASSFVVLLLNLRVLLDGSKAVKGVFAICALLPMIFISLIAVDYGRWTMFAVANAWLAAVAVRIMQIETAPVARRDAAIAIGVKFVLTAIGSANHRAPTFITGLAEKKNLWSLARARSSLVHAL